MLKIPNALFNQIIIKNSYFFQIHDEIFYFRIQKTLKYYIMKKLKKMMLKDASVLTDEEKKEIIGGAEKK